MNDFQTFQAQRLPNHIIMGQGVVLGIVLASHAVVLKNIQEAHTIGEARSLATEALIKLDEKWGKLSEFV